MNHGTADTKAQTDKQPPKPSTLAIPYNVPKLKFESTSTSTQSDDAMQTNASGFDEFNRTKSNSKIDIDDSCSNHASVFKSNQIGQPYKYAGLK